MLLRAPQERVWRAISNAKEFGTWFGVEFEGDFAPGKSMVGKMVPTKADADVAKMQEHYRGMTFEMTVERIEPMHHFSYRWHPFAIDPSIDYSNEPTTLVEFTLESTSGGTMLTVLETGFDAIPLARRTVAWEANNGGWTMQTSLLENYLKLATS